MNLTPPDDLYASRSGDIRCLNHMPVVGSYGWTHRGWRKLTDAERASASGKPVQCPDCAAMKRHEGQRRSPR